MAFSHEQEQLLHGWAGSWKIREYNRNTTFCVYLMDEWYEPCK